MIIILLLILFGCYKLFNKEVLYPPIIAVMMFSLCSIIGLLRFSDWHIDQFSFKSCCFLLLGVVSFIIGGIVIYSQRKHQCYIIQNFKRRINLNNKIVLLGIIINALFIVLFYSHILTTVKNHGYSNLTFSQILLRYYYIKSYTTDISLPSFLLILKLLCLSSSIISVFVFLHNLSFQQFRRKDFYLLLIVGFQLIYSFLNSSRSDLLVFLSQTICLLYFFWNMKIKRLSTVSLKILKWGIRAFCLFLIIFIMLAVTMGRKKSFQDINICNYLTIYTSSSIRNFDLYINSNTPHSSSFGKETFYPINRILYNRFGIGEFYTMALPFNSIDGKNIGNIYTAFRRYYADFGLFGIIFLPFLLGFFFSILYNRAYRKARMMKISFSMLLFSCLISSIFYLPIEDHFFIYDLSLNRICLYFIVYILYRILIKHNVIFAK